MSYLLHGTQTSILKIVKDLGDFYVEITYKCQYEKDLFVLFLRRNAIRL